ncbi:MAG: ABC transporter ATP-binding protein [Bacteroidetes bacterium]|nr:ABC transporter ATP-binding protein [Bacteroidota bacterium]
MILATNLIKTYGSYTALSGASCSIPAGEFLAIMGESGSGKSTFLNLIYGIDTVDSGSLSVFGNQLDGKPVNELHEYRRNFVSIIFQDFNLLPTLTAWENVILPLKLQGKPVDPAWISFLFEEVGLTSRQHKLPETLSGGENQRVAIARALAVKPKVLVADEPTGSLDSRTGREVLDLLRTVNRDLKVTILMATHSKTASEFADRILRIEDGRFLQ